MDKTKRILRLHRITDSIRKSLDRDYYKMMEETEKANKEFDQVNNNTDEREIRPQSIPLSFQLKEKRTLGLF